MIKWLSLVVIFFGSTIPAAAQPAARTLDFVGGMGITFTNVLGLSSNSRLYEESETIFHLHGGARMDLLTINKKFHVVPGVFYQRQFVSDEIFSTVEDDYRFEYSIHNVALRCDVHYYLLDSFPLLYFGGGVSVNFVTFETSISPAFAEVAGQSISASDMGETKTDLHAVFGGMLTDTVGLESQVLLMNDFSQISLAVIYRLPL